MTSLSHTSFSASTPSGGTKKASTPFRANSDGGEYKCFYVTQFHPFPPITTRRVNAISPVAKLRGPRGATPAATGLGGEGVPPLQPPTLRMSPAVSAMARSRSLQRECCLQGGVQQLLATGWHRWGSFGASGKENNQNGDDKQVAIGGAHKQQHASGNAALALAEFAQLRLIAPPNTVDGRVGS